MKSEFLTDTKYPIRKPKIMSKQEKKYKVCWKSWINGIVPLGEIFSRTNVSCSGSFLRISADMGSGWTPCKSPDMLCERIMFEVVTGIWSPLLVLSAESSCWFFNSGPWSRIYTLYTRELLSFITSYGCISKSRAQENEIMKNLDRKTN